MNDIRIFSDKIARDPRQLGLKGALDKRPLGTGNKSERLLGYKLALKWQLLKKRRRGSGPLSF